MVHQYPKRPREWSGKVGRINLKETFEDFYKGVTRGKYTMNSDGKVWDTEELKHRIFLICHLPGHVTGNT